MSPTILTIGHSTHILGTFIGLLLRHQVTAVADVRSVPYSQFQAQFNREALKDALKAVTGGKNVEISVNVDPSIIGGLVVRLGSRMVDGSLRTKLNAIRLAMKEVG